jgi:hypothetical protein
VHRRPPAGLRPAITQSPLELPPGGLGRQPDAGGELAHRAFAVLRYLDIVLVLLATPVVLTLGAPALGYAVGAGAWIAQRIIAQADKRWVSKAAEPRTQLGLNLFEAFGRIWLLAGAIVVAGVAGGRADGLTAAVTICGAYTVAFAIRVFSGPPTSPTSSRSQRRVSR